MADFYNPYEPVDQHGSSLPHWQQGEAIVFVTWRLADSLPAEKLEQLRRERKNWLLKNPQPWNSQQVAEYRELFSVRVESWLDAGAGSCCLRHPELRQIVDDSLQYFNDERYRLDSFVIMPNHVHALFQPEPRYKLKAILHTWKSFSSKEIHRATGQTGALWAETYWDRLIRNQAHLDACRRYIRKNPEKAKLSIGEYTLYPQK